MRRGGSALRASRVSVQRHSTHRRVSYGRDRLLQGAQFAADAVADSYPGQDVDVGRMALHGTGEDCPDRGLAPGEVLILHGSGIDQWRAVEALQRDELLDRSSLQFRELLSRSSQGNHRGEREGLGYAQ